MLFQRDGAERRIEEEEALIPIDSAKAISGLLAGEDKTPTVGSR